MKYSYELIFAREYSGYREICGGIEEVFRVLHGRILRDWRFRGAEGLHYLEFGSSESESEVLLIWYADPLHCKIQLSGRGMPELKESLHPIDHQERHIGMEIQDMYVLSGENPAICISLSDAFFAPEKEELLQFILPPGNIRQQVQILRIPDNTPFRVLSTEPIPGTKHFKRTQMDRETEEYFVSVIDADGRMRIPPKYHDIDLMSLQPELYRTSIRKEVPGGDGYSLYGLCDAAGKEIIPCIYPDLYYMANGYVLVMDYRHKWWVLNEKDEAIFGPHNNGVDICSHNREYLYFIEYNEAANCETLGIYSIALRTALTEADYIRIRYLGDDTFEAQQFFAPGDVRTVHINAYGDPV